MSETKSFNITEIMKLLPHRYPFLFLDAVTNCISGDEATGVKNVSMNEWFFAGHFPHEPVMPGVLIIEALAQLSGVVMLADQLDNQTQPRSMYFVKIEEATFRAKVTPGSVLTLHSKKIRQKMGMAIFEASAKIGETIAAEAKIIATLG